MTKTGESFQHLNDIFSSLFLVIRNKRSKDLNDTANDCFIQSIDMIMDWYEHGSLDNEVLLEIAHILRDNTNAKEMKHDKVMSDDTKRTKSINCRKKRFIKNLRKL